MKKLVLYFALFFILTSYGQDFWKPVYGEQKSVLPSKQDISVEYLISFDLKEMAQYLQNAPDRFSKQKGLMLSFPNVDGISENFEVFESSNFEPELQAQFPDIRSYVGIGLDDPTAYLRFSLSPLGIQTMVLRADKGSEFIEPYSADRTVYVLFNSHNRNKGELPFECQTHDTKTISDEMNLDNDKSSDQVYRTFRLAISCTGEYAQYHGGTQAAALAGMNATMTRVNGVYEKDLAVHLNIISNNTAVIYTNASTDPYSNASIGTDPDNFGTLQGWNLQLQNTLTSVLGNAAYDIGHLFGASGGGGNAGCIGCVCEDDTTSQTDMNKGSGFTSPANGMPEGDLFDIDYVAHEMGHQLGANHTFTYAYEGTSAQVEPGSASTIMGYAGITNYNVQSNSDDYFTYKSILQIQNNIDTNTCSVNTPITNQVPTVNVNGTSVTIPKGTPFKLTATASDPEGNTLTYNWEQNNPGNSTTVDDLSVGYPTKTAGPNFRSFSAVSSNTRYFPSFSKVLNGILYDQWECLSDVGRTFVFTATVRDIVANASQTKTASKGVTVNASAGPFKVNFPSTGASVAAGTPINITWDVAGTNASPINVSNVKISLSTNNGTNFTTLLASTANDGSESVTIPSGTSSQNAYIMIESINNVFYALSGKFLIGYTATTQCNTYTYSGSAIPIPDGTGANEYGTVVYSTIAVPAQNGIVTSANVYFNTNHTYIQDLVFGIINPQNTDVYLWARQCNGENGINATFSDSGSEVICAQPVTGTVLPYESLSAVNGNPQVGNWRLFAADGYNGDTGSILGWNVKICSTVYTPMSIQDYTFAYFEIYPNPSNGIFNIRLQSENNAPTHIDLYDLSGRLIQSKNYNDTSGELNLSVDFSNVANGIYLIKINKGNEKTSRQIIID